MPRIPGLPVIIGAVIALGMLPSLPADILAELPAGLADRLEPVAEISLDSLDDDSRAQLREARGRVAAALEGAVPDEELADAWGELGALYHVHAVYGLAGRCYSNALQLAPGQFRWTYLAAYLDAETGQLDQAVAGFQTARKLRPDYLALNIHLADAWLDLSELDKAREAYLAVQDEPGLQAAALYGLGQIALLRRDPAQAVDYLRRAVDIQPAATRIHYPLARALRARGDDEAARRHLALQGDQLPVIRDPQVESLRALKQGARLHFHHGMKAMRKQDYAAARDAFARGLAREPDNTDARISYARSLYLAGDVARAEEELNNVLVRDAAKTLARYLLGILAEAAGDTETALGHYRTVLEQEPAHDGALFNLANHHYRLGDYEQAAELYAACVQAAPENMVSWLVYTGALLRADRDRSAILAVLDTARERFSEQPMLQFLHIQLLACAGEKGGCDAPTALARARELHDRQPIPPHRELLALALAATGDFTAAAGIQEALMSDAMLMMPPDVGRLDSGLQAFRAGQMPQAQHVFTWRLIQAPPVHAIGAFRDYPAPRPY